MAGGGARGEAGNEADSDAEVSLGIEASVVGMVLTRRAAGAPPVVSAGVGVGKPSSITAFVICSRALFMLANRV